jgi:hypothetical protein
MKSGKPRSGRDDSSRYQVAVNLNANSATNKGRKKKADVEEDDPD